MFKFFRHIESGVIHVFGPGVNVNWDNRRAVCGRPLYSESRRNYLYSSYEGIDDDFSKHSAKMLCGKCIASLFSAGKYKFVIELLSSADDNNGVIDVIVELIMQAHRDIKNYSYAVTALKNYYKEKKGICSSKCDSSDGEKTTASISEIEELLRKRLEHSFNPPGHKKVFKFDGNLRRAGLLSALLEANRQPGPSEEYPLYVYITGDQKAYLHQGSATTPQEAMNMLQHISEDAMPTAILEVTSCKMLKLGEITSSFCASCGAEDVYRKRCSCVK